MVRKRSLVRVQLWAPFRSVAQLVEQRSPKPQVGGSIPSWPASFKSLKNMMTNKQTEIKSAKPTYSFDWLKWSFIVVLIAVGVWANYHYNQIDWAFRFAGWIVLTCFLVFIALQTAVGRNSWRFAQEARIELRKVVWPTRQETVQTTIIVIAMVMLMAIILWGLDTLFLWIVSLLTGQKG